MTAIDNSAPISLAGTGVASNRVTHTEPIRGQCLIPHLNGRLIVKNLRSQPEKLQSLILIMMMALLYFLGSPAQAQVNFLNVNPGQPLIYYSPGTLTTDAGGTVVDVYVESLADGVHDMCYKINSVWNNVANTSPLNAVVDARGFAGPQNCTQNPIPSGAKGILLLGNAVITTMGEWVIPAGVEVRGVGTSSLSGSQNTVIKAGSTQNLLDGAVVKLGASGGDAEAKIDNLTIDCDSSSSNNCIYGIMNVNAINNSWVQNVVIQNASTVGLMVAVAAPGAGGADSGTYQGITIQYTSSACCNAATIGIELAGLDDGTLVRGLEDVNVFGCGISGGVGKFGIYVNRASTKIVNANLQCFQTGLQIGCVSNCSGTNTTTHDVQADNIYYHCTNGSHCTSAPAGIGVGINPSTSSAPAANITLGAVSGTDGNGSFVTNLISDTDVTNGFGQTVYQGGFLLGDPTIRSGCLGLISSDPNVPWQTPNGIIQ